MVEPRRVIRRGVTFVVSGALLLASASAIAAEDVAAATNEGAVPRLRGGVNVGLGAGGVSGVFAAGPGFGAELGVQLWRWLALSAYARGESAFVAGRTHVHALVQVAPIDWLEISVGPGIGALYTWRFARPNDTATVGSLVVRPAVHLRTGEALFGLRTRWHLTLSAEGEVGFAASGSRLDDSGASVRVEEGAPFFAGRLAVGFLL